MLCSGTAAFLHTARTGEVRIHSPRTGLNTMAGNNPKLLIMDEPSEGLAPTVVETLIETIKELAAQGMGLLVVEQNLGVATTLADRVIVMVAGSIAAETTSQELLADPEAQKRFLGVEPLPDAA